MIPRKLSALDVPKILSHLQSLKGEDRRLRFGGGVSDTYIQEYVENSFVAQDSKWFGVDHIDGHIIAACHVAIMDGQAELGCSVHPDYRGNGLAQKMFDRAVTWLRSKNITEVYMHCLTENQVMKHIARKNNMTLESEYGETDALVEVRPPTPMTQFEDAYMDRVAMYDMIYRTHINMMKRLYRA